MKVTDFDVLDAHVSMTLSLLTFISTATHPLKKGLDKKINIRLLTPVFIIIYQAEPNLWCPGNVGWGNFA